MPGDERCCNQCDLRTPTDAAQEGWWYSPVKNKWKLRKTAERRHLIRQGVQPDTTPVPRPSSAKVRQRPLPPSSNQAEETKGSSSAPGVWTREWTKASVSLDCNTYKAKIDMKGP